MTFADQVRVLSSLAEERPTLVRSKICIGDLISRNLHLGSFIYQIDDLEIGKELGAFFDDTSFYLALEAKLRKFTTADYLKIFPPESKKEGRMVTPFSATVKEGVGECLEKAILVQLRQQPKTLSFLIHGLLGHDATRRNFAHAYNIVFINDQGYLVDSQNPTIVKLGEEKTLVPYVAPFTGIERDRVIVHEQWRAGRIYQLVPEIG